MAEYKITRKNFLKMLGLGGIFLAMSGAATLLPKESIQSRNPSSREFSTTSTTTTLPAPYLKTSVWVHGNVVRAEPQGGDLVHRDLELARRSAILQVKNVNWSDIVGYPQRWGTTFYGKANTTNWFNFPISNPIISDGKSMALQKVHVLYNTSPGVFINAIDIFDGSVRIKNIPCNLYGNNTGKNRNMLQDLREGITTWTISPTEQISWGPVISINVVFNRESSITFVAAGADFIRR